MTIIGLSVIVVLSTIPLNRMVGRTFVPEEDMGQITVHLDTPQGTSLEGTVEAARDIVKDLTGLEGVGQLQYVAGMGKVNHFHVMLFLKPLNERNVSQADIVATVRQILSTRPGSSPTVTGRTALGGSGEGGGGGGTYFAIQASLQGPDVGKLYDYSQALLGAAQQTPSLVDAKTNYSNASPEVRVAVDRARAADLGVRMSTIGGLLRLMVAGDDEISTYREGSEQYPVKMRVLEEQRRDIDTVGKLTVPSSTAGSIRIDNIARFERGFGPTDIRRVNRQFAIDMQTDVAPGHALDEASNDVRRLIADLHLPPGYTARLYGQTQILDETTANLMMALLLASIFVYMVLAAQFESFVQPIVIMLVLPVSVPFALFTLWITGRTLNLWSALGVLLLLGIVKKNSILQVDYTNTLREQGMERHEALVVANHVRLRPILMTTISIVAGMLPIAFGRGAGAGSRASMAVTIIGGQMLCLLLTLLIMTLFAWVMFYLNAGAATAIVGALLVLIPASDFAVNTMPFCHPATAKAGRLISTNSHPKPPA